LSQSTDDSLLKEYGLEFIKDLAKDRKNAIQSLGVSFTGMKNDILTRSNIITRKQDREYIENILKSFDNEVNRTIESQLTRITIKSFNWIKEVLLQDKRIIIEKKDEELVNKLQKELKDQSNEVSRLKHMNDSLENQLQTKTNEYESIEQKFSEFQQETHSQLNSEKTKSENLIQQVKELENKQSDIEEQLSKTKSDLSSLEEENTSIKIELVEKSSEITRLNDTISQQAAEAMETWASAYSEQQEIHQKSLKEQQIESQEQEEQYQQRLQDVKHEFEETMNQKINETTDKYQKEIGNLSEKLLEEVNKRNNETRDLNLQINELQTRRDFLEGRNERLDTQVNELLELNKNLTKEVTESKIKLDEIKAELEEAKDRKEQDQRLKTLNKVQNVNEYIEQVLSLSNYAPITILVRMGEMNLDALAQSVGMDPIVLENQLQRLHQHDLIDIRNDGTIRANISTKVRKEKIY
jgi:chromosome segregation ATPase